MKQSDLLSDYVKTALMYKDRPYPISDKEAIVLNKIIDDFDYRSNRLYKKYENDISTKRISKENQIKLGQDFLTKHGHVNCIDYKASFIRDAYFFIIANSAPEDAQMAVGEIIKNYTRCHTHRRILDGVTPAIIPDDIIRELNQQFQSGIKEFAEHLATSYPIISFEAWKQRIKRFRKKELEQAKKGTGLH